jgi:DNA ligase-1
MKDFAQLIHALDSTNKTTQKQEAIWDFLQVASEPDKRWFLALFTGKKPKVAIPRNALRQWALEQTQIPEWLFAESYAAVGDLGETIALLLPPPSHQVEHSLSEWIAQIAALKQRTDEEKKAFVLESWDSLNTVERFIFNKLLGGSFRIGVASKTLINTLAKFYKLDPSAVAHSISGQWHPEEVEFEALVHGEYTDTALSKPYPFCLAYALDKTLEELGDPADWIVEYKWDGIRSQSIHRSGEVHIWSRGEELVTAQFPEIAHAISQLPLETVIDGELVVYKEGRVQDFNELQKRLGRKKLTHAMLEELPVALIAYDLLEYLGQDLRSRPFHQRRTLLKQLLAEHPLDLIHLSEQIEFNDWKQLNPLRQDARLRNSEGLMLKSASSLYHAGRKRGDWWKWKLDPLSIDAVLIYAQKGSGRRSAYYTDYTFGVKNGDQIVTIAKAYSGLTDKEIQEVSRFINKNVLEKFGPVRTVRPALVFEIGFEGISFSNRHKSGVALRFPRILRWRRDKTVEDIDHMEEIKKLIP